jgi:hypothetical protein
MTANKTLRGESPGAGESLTASGRLSSGGTSGASRQQFGSASGWLIPSRIELFEESSDLPELAYTNAPPHPRVEAGPGLFDGFLRLESGSNETILAYANRWGPLWLCDAHDLPFRHDPECRTFSDFEAVSEEELERASQPEEQGKSHIATAWFQETLAGWRALSTQMRATLRIARRLHDGLSADDTDWDTLPFLRDILVELVVPGLEDPLSDTEDYTNVGELERRSGLRQEDVAATVRLEFQTNPPPEPWSPHGEEHEVFWEAYYRLAEAIGRQQMQSSVEFQRQVLAPVLNHWLSLAGVRPRLEWGARSPQMQLGGDGLIGALAVELFFACSQSGGLALCVSCGTPFLPVGRRRRRDLNAYCSECGLKAAMRDASARYRKTQKYQANYGKWREQRRGPDDA